MLPQLSCRFSFVHFLFTFAEFIPTKSLITNTKNSANILIFFFLHFENELWPWCRSPRAQHLAPRYPFHQAESPLGEFMGSLPQRRPLVLFGMSQTTQSCGARLGLQSNIAHPSSPFSSPWLHLSVCARMCLSPSVIIVGTITKPCHLPWPGSNSNKKKPKKHTSKAMWCR